MSTAPGNGGMGDDPATAGGQAKVRRYMVVAYQTLGGEELVRIIRERAARSASEFWVVVPATPVNELASASVPMMPMPVMGGVLRLPGSPQEARRLAEEKLQTELRQLAAVGAKVDGEVGDGDPMQAVKDALGGREFDEIIVSTLPGRRSRWLRQDLPGRIERRFRIPVTHVEAPAGSAT